MVTITTTVAEDKEKTSNCLTPKKKAANNTSAAASTTEATTEQTAPNILVYKKVSDSKLISRLEAEKFLPADGIDRRANASGEQRRDGANGESFHVEDSIRVQWSRPHQLGPQKHGRGGHTRGSALSIHVVVARLYVSNRK